MKSPRRDLNLISPEVLESLMEAFFGGGDAPGALDWRAALDREELDLRVVGWEAGAPRIAAVTFLSDRVTQLASPRSYDPVRCALTIHRALNESEGSR